MPHWSAVLKEKNLALEAEVEELKVLAEGNRMEIFNLRNWLNDLHLDVFDVPMKDCADDEDVTGMIEDSIKCTLDVIKELGEWRERGQEAASLEKMCQIDMSNPPSVTKANLFQGDMSHPPSVTKANLSQGDMSHPPSVTTANLSQGDMSHPSITKANLSQSEMSLASVTEVNLSQTGVSLPSVSKANLSLPEMSHPSVSKANLSQSEMSFPSVSKAKLAQSGVSHPSVTKAKVSQTEMAHPSIPKAKVSQSERAQPSVPKAKLSQYNLSQQSVSGSGSSGISDHFDFGTCSQVLAAISKDSDRRRRDRGGACWDWNVSDCEVARGEGQEENEFCGSLSLVDEMKNRSSTPVLSSRAIFSPHGFQIVGIEETNSLIESPFLESVCSFSICESPFPMKKFFEESGADSMDWTLSSTGSSGEEIVAAVEEAEDVSSNDGLDSDSDFECPLVQVKPNQGLKIFNFSQSAKDLFEVVILKKIDAMKEGKCDKYAKLTLYSFVSKFMSECATDQDMAKVKLTSSERSKKVTVCQDQKFELMDLIFTRWSKLGFREHRHKLGQMKLKTEVNRTVGLKLKNVTASVRRKERVVAGNRRIVKKNRQ